MVQALFEMIRIPSKIEIALLEIVLPEIALLETTPRERERVRAHT